MWINMGNAAVAEDVPSRNVVFCSKFVFGDQAREVVASKASLRKSEKVRNNSLVRYMEQTRVTQEDARHYVYGYGLVLGYYIHRYRQEIHYLALIDKFSNFDRIYG